MPEERVGEVEGRTADCVICRSDQAYADRPTALCWLGQRLEITAILSGWRVPQGKHFLVRTSEGQTFDLFYDECEDSWEIFTR